MMTDLTSKNKQPFLMLNKSRETLELLKKPDAFMLLTQIAIRAKRTDDFTIHNLEIGEALIGDFRNIGLTQRRYRTAKNDIQKYKLATFKATNKGTVAKLTNSSIYNINIENIDKQSDKTETSKATRQRRLTINKRNKEDNNINIDDQFEKFWQEYKSIHTSKGNKQEAKEKFIKALKTTTFEKISTGLENYMKDCHSKNIYTKQVIVWLNKKCWEDEYETLPRNEKESPLVDFINKMCNDTLLTSISVSDSNKAVLKLPSKDHYDRLVKLPDKIRNEIKERIANDLATTGIEFKY